MRILLVTEYPPPRDGFTEDALHIVRELRAEGHSVEVVSPQPSGATQHVDLATRRGLLALARLARRADRVMLRVRDGHASPPPSTLHALRAARAAEVRAYDLAPDGAWARALDRAPGRVRVVHLELHPAPAPVRAADGTPPGDTPWPVGADRTTVMTEIRSRAGRRREVASADPISERRSAPVRRIPPLALPPPVSLRPGMSVAKRLVRRLTAWQIEPIVAQLNRLREALVEALEARPPDDPHEG